MRLFSALLAACMILGYARQLGADELPHTSAVQAGERLTYDISWLGIVAGTAVMEVNNDGAGNGNGALRLVTTARSSPKVTVFYPVDNRVESLVDPRSFQSESMTFRRREGKRKNDFVYTFHHREGTVTAVKDGVEETLPIPPGTLDAISCLYYVRSTLSLTPGTSQSLNVHHDKKNYKLEVRVEGLDTIEGSWGKMQAARLLVIMPFQGIFLNQGNIRVWLANDNRRIPLRMKAKVIIGSIVADLVSGFPSTAFLK
ncbi:MAG TPA: DUF3108 domain-containing protein [Nitrospira sp.]|nr:DUF3108 domain-containing protein [Nitrospira sp.]